MKKPSQVKEQCKEEKISILLSEFNSTLELYCEKDIEEDSHILSDN